MSLPPFQRLLDDHSHDVHRFLVASVGRRDADDCYQETWVAALDAYPRLRHATNLRGWLFTIAARKATDAHRRRSRETRAAMMAMAQAPETASRHAATALLDDTSYSSYSIYSSYSTDTSGTSGTAGIADDLWAAVAALPAKQRAAVVMRHLLDADYATIAAAMGISEPAARRNVHEGLKRLREEHGIDWST